MSDTVQENRGTDAGGDEPLRGLGGLRGLFGHVGRLGKLASGHRLLVGLAAVGVLVVAGGILAAGVFIWGGEAKAVTLEEALAALDAGLYPEARRMGEKLVETGSPLGDSAGGPQFVIGAAVAYAAERGPATNRKTQHLLSSRYLEEARDLGFPPDRRGEGLFLLGRSLFLGGQIPASRPVFEEALESAPQHRLEILRLLGEAYLADASPDYGKAFAVNEKYLAERAMLPGERRKGLLQRARILLRLKKTQECLATLAEIPEDTPEQAESIMIRAELLMAEGEDLLSGAEPNSERRAAGLKKYDAAIAILETGRRRADLSAEDAGKTMYLEGVCLLRKGEVDKALAQLAATSRGYPGSAEALAADLELAEQQRGRGQSKEALAAYQRALAAAGDPEDYSNPWVPLAEIQRRGLAAYEDYFQKQSFDQALLLAESLASVLAPAGAAELIARGHAEWGRQMLAAAQEEDPAGQQAAGREHLRRAGAAYAALAKLRMVTNHYPEDLWQSAECCREGGDYAGAAAALREFLKSAPRPRHPQALVDLGEAQLNLGRPDAALESLLECIEVYPRDASAYRARWIASRAYAEKGEMGEAEAMLSANLNGQLTPDSIEWRASLLAMGKLLYRERRYGEAAERLAEAVRRYPGDPQAINARFLLAECDRAEADRLRKQLEGEPVESVRRANLRKAGERLASAIESYRFVQQALNDRQENQQLSALDQKTLRNCYFAIAAAWFDLGDYEQAIHGYLAASTRYQNEPEALDAYVQIARAYRRLNDPQQARATLRQGGEALKRLAQRPEFLQVTNFDAQEWKTVFEWLKTL